MIPRTDFSFSPDGGTCTMARSRISRRTALKLTSAAVLSTALAVRSRRVLADVPRSLPAGQLPKDRRLEPLKDLDGYFGWTPSPTPEAWAERAEKLRRQILVACGLWPMPARPAITASIHGKVERDDYTVERVSFESHPGLYVTGSLYRPKSGGDQKRPAVLCPHGHWANGRFYDHGEAQGKKQLESGGEKFEFSGRFPLQARCVQLARMGCVVFLYDMLGYADNTTLSFELIHRFGKQRPEMSQPDRWGLFSAQSELRCLNALGLQTWNSVRALDWIETLPDVDPERIGVTGASGGGTQTFLIGDVDSRPIAFFPAVMVSTAMQGGCTCENATYLRVNTGNIEMAALLAPRTVGLSAANDWTKELETKGLPELKQHFAMMGVPDRISGKYIPYEHNYNQVSRMMMYGVFQKALGLPAGEIVERDFQPLTKDEATVWNAEHPQPPAGDEAELKVMRAFAAEFDQQLRDLEPTDPVSLAEYRRVIGGGWDVLIGRDLKATGNVEHEHLGRADRSGYAEFNDVVRNKSHGEELPVVTLIPENWNQKLVLWLTDSGKAGLYGGDGNVVPAVRKLLDGGAGVVGVDLLHQGEFQADGKPLAATRSVKNSREFLGYTTGYNHPLFSQRVHDVLSLIAVAKSHGSAPAAIHLAGFGHAALIAAAAAVQAGTSVAKLAVGTGGYRLASITEIRDPMLLPGAVRYGDVPGLLALRTPQPLWLHGEGADAPRVVRAAYLAAGRLTPDRLTLSTASNDQAPLAAAEWLAQ
jgi:dienelactone hydrolase